MAEAKVNELMEKIVSLCKRRGFVYQSSEIYGGINGFWDYGPPGAELKRNVKDLWWRTMVHNREDVVGLEATIIMAPQIWKASGHVDTFADLMVEDPHTKKRYRADQIEPQSGMLVQFGGALYWNRLLPVLETLGISPEQLNRCHLEEQLAAAVDHDAAIALVGSEILRIKPDLKPDPFKHVSDEARMLFCGGMMFSGRNLQTNFSRLIPFGKPPNSVRSTIRERLSRDAMFFGESQVKIENSTEYSPDGSLLSEARPFNLMLQTWVGPIQSDENVAYLRPETAQAIFAQFKNVLDSSRQKVPFGIAQMGKAFRNEVTPRNFTFRSREFEQMELEYFIKPDEAIEAICGSVAQPTGPGHPGEPQPNWGWQLWHQYWVEERIRFYEGIGLPRTTLEEYWQKPEELAHYARATVDILFKFPFGTQELEGIAARSDFDLSQHERFSGKPMGVFDEELRGAWAKLDGAKQKELEQRYYDARYKYLTKVGVPAEAAAKDAREDADGLAKGQYIPHVIEPSAGVDRLILALIANAYSEDSAPDEKGKLETRVVMRLHPRVAPVKVAIFPLLRNKPDLVQKAREVRDLLRPHMTVFYDDGGAIGRRYRRQDEAGTPFGVTIDFDTLGEKGPELLDTVTLRDRDTMEQTRIKINELVPLLLGKIR